MRLRLGRVPSPIGTMLVVTDEGDALRALEFHDFESRLHRSLRLHHRGYSLEERVAPALLMRALSEYFDGNVRAIDAIRVATGGTAFQREVWAALRGIPVGLTSTYGRLASELGRPKSSRAVGAANGANPVSVVVPCHRVIASNGDLTGYGGGIERKRWLLDHERR